MEIKFTDQICSWLKEMNYTHCFFVAGGNIMHFLDSARQTFTCVPFVHEVGAAIATEYFNESNSKNQKAFCLVTAGPGITNAITGIAGAWLESRELLIVGGQVKTSDLSLGKVRQRGIQEIDGTSLVKSLTTRSQRIDRPISKSELENYVKSDSSKRRGPIFLEIPIDVQGTKIKDKTPSKYIKIKKLKLNQQINSKRLLNLLSESAKPVLLLGGGVSRDFAQHNIDNLSKTNIPIMTTWNAIDRYASDQINFFGRPNTWGQRYSNILLQQSDLILAVGTRLGLQQTGFNWKEFAPRAKIVQVDIDKAELKKGHPLIHWGINKSSEVFLRSLFELTDKLDTKKYSDWVQFCQEVKKALPNDEDSNTRNSQYINPYNFCEILSDVCEKESVIIPCSSGSSFTVPMQSFNFKQGQIVVSNKGLASMGYGLSGAIGACLAQPDKTVVLIEGDGGFAQNLQELGTLMQQNLNLKIFVWANEGYASIRMTQKNYFNGAWIGCDKVSGLGLPNWKSISEAYSLNYKKLDPYLPLNEQLKEIIYKKSSIFVEVPIDPEQTYYPKISSKVLDSGQIISNPLHFMTPELNSDLSDKVFRYL